MWRDCGGGIGVAVAVVVVAVGVLEVVAYSELRRIPIASLHGRVGEWTTS